MSPKNTMILPCSGLLQLGTDSGHRGHLVIITLVIVGDGLCLVSGTNMQGVPRVNNIYPCQGTRANSSLLLALSGWVQAN